MNKILEKYLDILKSENDFSFINTVVYQVSGTDSLGYIHNQSTNNVLKLNDNQFCINAVLDNKASVVSPFVLIKVTSELAYIIVNSKNEQALVERLARFIISEDVLLEKTSLTTSFSPARGEFSGQLFGFKNFISFDVKESYQSDELNSLSQILCSQGTDLNFFSTGKLFNNTILFDVAYDKNKGCFLGQETVAKIASNRGASFYPTLVKSVTNVNYEEKLSLDSRKIATINCKYDGFYNMNLSRDFRINDSNLKIESDTLEILAYPLYTNSQEFSSKIYNLALELFHKEELDKSCDLLKFCLLLNPKMEDACEVLGIIYGHLERYDEAISLMQKLSEINPKSVMAHTNMSLFYMKQGEIEKAEIEKSNATVKTFERFGDEAKVKEESIKREAEIELERKRKVSMFNKVLEIDADDTLANFGLGQAYLHDKLYKKAIERLEIVISNDPKYSVAYLNLSKALLGLKNKLEAKKVLTTGISVAAKNGDLMPANEMQSLLNKHY